MKTTIELPGPLWARVRHCAIGGLLGLAFACSESTSDPGGPAGGTGGAATDAGSGGSAGEGAAGAAGANTAGANAAGADTAGAGGSSAGSSDAGAPDAGADLVIASGQSEPIGVALGGGDVYWANQGDGTIVRCPKSGCGEAGPALLTSGYPGLQGIALQGSTLYWVTRHEADGGTTSEVMKCDVSACGSGVAAEPNPGPRGGFGPYGITASDERVYVAAWTELLSCPLLGCGVDPPLSHADSAGITGIALGSDQLYVARFGGGTITACPLAGCAGTETPLVSGITALLAFARDESSLYWSQYSYRNTNADGLGSLIRACPLSGCDLASARVLASGQFGAAGIAVDDSYLYYTDHLNGRVVRTSKQSLSDACAPAHYERCGTCGGLTRCDGSCSVTTPADFGDPCGTCGGTVECSGACSITECP